MSLPSTFVKISIPQLAYRAAFRMITASKTVVDPTALERHAGDYLGIGDTLVSLLSSDNLKCVIWGVDALFPLICPLQVL